MNRQVLIQSAVPVCCAMVDGFYFCSQVTLCTTARTLAMTILQGFFVRTPKFAFLKQMDWAIVRRMCWDPWSWEVNKVKLVF
jgi:hypothetical protein